MGNNKYLSFTKKVFLLLCFLGISETRIVAQQNLNLDFETKSIEGISRPWSWDINPFSRANISLDSIVKYQGKYSLKVETFEEGIPETLSYFFEPFELKNKTVKIEGWVNTKDFKGEIGFVVRIITSIDTTVLEIKSESIDNADHWRKLNIEKQFPDNITSVSLLFQKEGTGSVWFDDFSLILNGQKKQLLEVAPPFTEKQVKWIRENSNPLKSLDPLKIDDENLSSFKSIVKDASIIALGESTHGSSEFFKLKHKLLEYSVKELGVRIFAIEDHQLIVSRVNNFVLGGGGTARASMFGMLGVWQTEEVHEMIKWIRNYNDIHPEDKLEFVGFDIQNHNLAIDSLYSFMSKNHLKLNNAKLEFLKDLKDNGGNSYAVSDSIKFSWYSESQQVLDVITTMSKNLLLRAKNKEDSLSVHLGLQYATLIKQFAENTYKGHESLYRDIAMAENVSWFHKVYKPGSKILIWAHDVHISRGDHHEGNLNIYFGKSMGAHLSKMYGSKYKAFGLFTYQGEYSCYVSYTNYNVTDCPLYVAPRGSLDEVLHRVASQLNSPSLFLDMRKARCVEWLTQAIPVRFANHINIEYGYWTRYSIPYQFDGLFFIDNTTSAKSYARK